MTPHDDLSRAFQAATVAELTWLGPSGRPDAQPVVPLWMAGRPAVALPYAYEELARTVAGAREVAVLLSDPRMTGSGWRALAATGEPSLIPDRDGHTFVGSLLNQELRKYPPARALADSPLLRREHWWYLPRLIVAVEVEAVTPVRARPDGTDHIAAVATDHGLAVDTVRLAEEPPSRVDVTSLSGNAVPDGAAVLLGHDFSVPDLERWTSWIIRGLVSNATLKVDDWPERTGLEPAPGVWQRLRRYRQLEKACRRALER